MNYIPIELFCFQVLYTAFMVESIGIMTVKNSVEMVSKLVCSSEIAGVFKKVPGMVVNTCNPGTF
jgi:hypothetical protein